MNLRLTGLLCVLCACLHGFAADPANRVIVIAHRGNHEHAHENTIEAIRDGIKVGADYVELDIRRTRDGQHVLSHDRSLKRMTGVEHTVDNLSLAQIRELKVSDSRRPEIPASRIPTFEEALDAIGHNIGLYLDFKDGDPVALAGEIRRREQTKQVIIYLGPPSVRAWRAAEPHIRLIMSVPEANLSPAALPSFLKANPGVVLDGDVTEYTSELVGIAHEKGFLIWPDIQNPGENPDQWSKALGLGVDGLQTDHPAQLIEWLKRSGRR